MGEYPFIGITPSSTLLGSNKLWVKWQFKVICIRQDGFAKKNVYLLKKYNLEGTMNAIP